MKKFNFILLLILCVLFSCKKSEEKIPDLKSEDISKTIQKMTELMVHDVTNPPLAARFFSYACLAGHEVVAQNEPGFKSMHGVLNGFPEIKKPTEIRNYSYQLSSLLAMMETAKSMQPSGSLFTQYQQEFLDSCRLIGFDEEVIKNSIRYAKEIQKQIVSFAASDNYNKISNYPRYTPSEKEGAWYPTPPGYFSPVEPYFNTVRPYTFDSASQFVPEPPVPFSTDKNSEFYKMMLEVYRAGGVELTEEHKKIAAFWDCNPFALSDNGHLMVGIKKISPGAHWMGITGIACKKAKVNFPESIKIFTIVSIGLMDGFIACWDEKYRSNRIRPETAIRKLIDPEWGPILQTPPFPEYLSGHSTISAASARILTYYFGENFSFKDTVEEPYGLPAREFPSFQKAAEEAAISRLYGGIHYMDAIERGLAQGSKVGKWVLSRIEKTDKTIASYQ